MSVRSREREERLARALRENLKRRKSRARAMAAGGGDNADTGQSGEPVDGAQSPPRRPNQARKPV